MFNEKNKLFLTFTLLCLTFIMISAVSAVSSDETNVDNSTVISSNDVSTSTVELSNNNVNKEINKKSSQNKLSDGEGSYSELSSLIETSSDLTLNKSYLRSETDDLIIINKTISIDGDGNTINANNMNGSIIIGSDANVTLKNIIMINNNGSNSFILSNGTLNLINVTFSNNTAVYPNAATLTTSSGIISIINSTFDSNNAAYSTLRILTTNVTIDNSNFTNNYGANSAIHLANANANVTITNSNFINNTRANYGGAINSQGTLIVDSCYFRNNSATVNGGAIAIRGKTANISNCEFVGNYINRTGSYSRGGAIFSSNNITLKNNTMTDNVAVNGSAIFMSSGNLNCNITFDNSTAVEDAEITLVAHVTDDMGNPVHYNTVTFVINDKNYTASLVEGVATTTIIESFNPGNYTITGSYNCAFDDSNIIEGNLEIIESDVFRYSTLQSLIDSTTESTITLSDDVKRSTVETTVNINKSITIDGNSHGINANNGTLFVISNGATVTLKNMVVYNTYGLNGSAINIESANVIIDNVTFENNSGYNFGSSMRSSLIYVNLPSTLILNNSLLRKNNISILCTKGNTTIDNTNVSSNKVALFDSDGTSSSNSYGFIDNEGKLTIYNSNFINNTANLAGIYGQLARYDMLVVNSSFINNTATTGRGGAIHHSETLTVTNSTFISNKVTRSSRDGGAISSNGDLIVISSIFVNNTATGEGSIVSNEYGNVNITNSVLIPSGRNSAVYNIAEGTVTVNYNWWGSNNNPITYLKGGQYWDDYEQAESDMPIADYWIIMQTELTNTTPLKYHETVNVTSSFNKATNAFDDLVDINGTILDGLNVTYSSNQGTFGSNQVGTVNGVATTTFTVNNEEFTITAKQYNQTNTISGKAVMPEPEVYIITDDTFYNYFNTDGTLKSTIVINSELQFSGEFEYKDMIINMPLNLTTHTTQAVFKNSTITIIGGAENTNVTNLIFNNSDYLAYVLGLMEVSDITIKNLTITQSNTEESHAISLNSVNHIIIDSNTITVSGPCLNVEYDRSYSISYEKTSAISGLDVYYTVINNNTITTSNISGSYNATGTIQSIILKGSPYADYYGPEYYADYNNITNNKVTTKGIRFTYGIAVMDSANYNRIDNNTVITESSFYSNAIEVGGPATGNNVTNNNITVRADNVTYALYISTNSWGAVTSTLVSNNTVVANSSSVYLIELFGVTGNTVTYNNLSGSGDYAMGIGAYNARTNTIEYNNIILKGTNNNTPVANDAIIAENTGIKLQYNSRSNIIRFNNITSNSTTSNYAINASVTYSNTITDNKLIAYNLYGDEAVLNNISTVANNTPLKTIIVTNDTYSTYFETWGELKEGYIPYLKEIKFSGTLKNKEFIFTDPLNITTDTTQATLINSTIYFLTGSGGSNLTNLIINNTNYSNMLYIDYVSNITVKNNTLIFTNYGNESYPIFISNSEKITIDSNNITLNAVSNPSGGNGFLLVPKAAAIRVYVSNSNKIINNNIVVKELDSNSTYYDTIVGISISGIYDIDYSTYDFEMEYANENIVSNNNITMNTNTYGYGIKIDGMGDENEITSNNINITGGLFAYGIEIDGLASANEVLNNIINLNAKNITYGIIISTNRIGANTENTINNNTINATSNNVYLIELFQSDENYVNNNTLYGYGNFTIGIAGYMASENEIKSNNITTYGNSANTPSETSDVVKSTNAGIIILKGTGTADDNEIIGNWVKTYDISPTKAVYTIITNGTDNTIENNTLYASNTEGPTSINATTGNTVQNNLPVRTNTTTTITVQNTTVLYNSTITLTVNVTDLDNNNITEGEVYFIISDEILTDEEDNIIKVNVTNGLAELNYTTTSSLNNTNIVAVYNGTNSYKPSTNTTTEFLVEKMVTINCLTDGARVRAGKTINFVAVITDNGRLVNGGRAVFKLNSNCLKDADGNVLYATVVNGIAKITYTIPNGYWAQDYLITVVYGGEYYYRSEVNGTLTIVKSTSYIKSNITLDSRTLTINMTVYDGGNDEIAETANNTISIKINNQTIKQETLVNGTLDTTVDLSSYASGIYEITIVCGEDNAYYRSEMSSAIELEGITNNVDSTQNPTNNSLATNEKLAITKD